MTTPSESFEELRGLLDALCEETITSEQFRRLETLILARPEAEAYYVQYMSLYADLSRQFTGTDYETTLPLPRDVPAGSVACDPLSRTRSGAALSARVSDPPVRTTTWRSVRPPQDGPETRPPFGAARLRLLAWGALSLTLLAAAAIWAVSSRLNDRRGEQSENMASGGTQSQPVLPQAPPAPAPEPLDDSVAILLRAPGAEWEIGGRSARPGATLSPGRLRLKSGFAHIEFYSGATVILEGPADFELISPLEAYCARGKLRATVPPQAQGFTIGSPRLDLVDRGTEFGMQVDGASATEVHVFDGKVELYDSGSARRAAPRQELTTGQALRVEGAGGGSSIVLNPGAFLSAIELAIRSEAELRRRHRDWLAFSAAIRQDPAMVLYYSFQAEQQWSRTLTNGADDPARSPAGVVVGCSTVAGRWPGKQALEFKRVSDRVRLHVSGEFDALTLATWVRVDGLPNRFNSLFMTDSWDDGEPHWHISADGKLELGVQGPNRKDGAHYYSPPVFSPERLGHWVHLAVTYDRAAARVVHYVDGAPIAELPIELDLPLVFGDAEIGNWNVTTRRHNHPIRHFSGRMDEFMLFARALTAEEIAAFHAQGQPQ